MFVTTDDPKKITDEIILNPEKVIKEYGFQLIKIHNLYYREIEISPKTNLYILQ